MSKSVGNILKALQARRVGGRFFLDRLEHKLGRIT